MAHWAEIDKNNIVLRVTVGDNNEPDEGYQWLIDNLGGTWIKTSYNTVNGTHVLGDIPFRKNFAGMAIRPDRYIPSVGASPARGLKGAACKVLGSVIFRVLCASTTFPKNPGNTW
mgnify:CR=1 FL=1